ncbi:LacI family DNA-binding transcriptional regulator [Schaalia sp. ZJ1691]|uniref:LacI family DNA-binding transcriptional regulator n=1 Tax=Schaalia sp. ZJ1691 TaxID=2709404 RepID=UPI0013EB1C70|nr:LacI family DNA-binding transcriptional regulator [Schaalia sp. ZJ1691]
MSQNLSRRNEATAPTPTPRKRATIKDVAAEAGVSVAAVSKVLRNAYGVSDHMRDTVNAAIEKLAYRPRSGARTMRGSSYTIGVNLVDFASPFQFEIAEAISSSLAQTQYRDIIVNGTDKQSRQRQRINDLLDHQVDGLVLVAPRLDSTWLERLAQTIPVVAIALHGETSSFDRVIVDELHGASLMVEHLTQLGHERIAHVAMPPGESEGQFKLSHSVRRQGFIEAMESRGLTPDVIESGYHESGGYVAFQRILERKYRPTALFASTDEAAFGALQAAQDYSVSVPEELSIAGYDNVPAARLGRVSLTTIDQSGHQTGEAAIRLLLERIEGRSEAVEHVIDSQLITRSTTGPVSQ